MIPPGAGGQADSGPAPPSFGRALAFWLKLGFLSFGGPAGQIAVMHAELVDRRRWIAEARFLHALNFCMVLPGPEAQQLATYLGWLLHGIRGGVMAGMLFILPSFLILLTLAFVYLRFGDLPVVAAILYGLKPAITAIVLGAAIRIGRRALAGPLHWSIAGAAFVGILVFNVPFPAILVGAALVGYAGRRWAPPAAEVVPAEATGRTGPSPGYVIDAHTPPPAMAHPARYLAIAGSIGVSLWAGTLVLLAATAGPRSVLVAMAWFFTKAALLTFGGAYAVLPYVFQGAVVDHQWLSAAQMMDGLALGETTPGPLIMIVAFVGFVGAWTGQVLGPGAELAAGVAGGTVAAFFTFLPSFILILGGAPLVERTRRDLRLAAILSAITAAVVGVIVNLAVFFAYHVLWPDGLEGPVALPALGIMALAFLAIWRWSIGVIPLIGACALAGLALHWAGIT